MENKHQLGFVFRQENCVGCQACTIACKIHNELPEDVRFRKVDGYEVQRDDGEVDVWLSHSCMHCGNPACLIACPAQAYTVRSDGLVVLNRDKCTGCGLCVSACPYDAVVMLKVDGRAAKCNMCIELIDQGLKPACVDGCPVKCLDTDRINQLLAQKTSVSKQGIGYGNCVTKPNMVIVKERL